MTIKKHPSRHRLAERTEASKKRLEAIPSPRSAVAGGEGDSPSNSWTVAEIANWKREHGYPPPDERILEPGYAGEVDNEEIAYIWQHVQADLLLAHRWGLRAENLKSTVIPRQRIQRMAMFGMHEVSYSK